MKKPKSKTIPSARSGNSSTPNPKVARAKKGLLLAKAAVKAAKRQLKQAKEAARKSKKQLRALEKELQAIEKAARKSKKKAAGQPLNAVVKSKPAGSRKVRKLPKAEAVKSTRPAGATAGTARPVAKRAPVRKAPAAARSARRSAAVGKPAPSVKPPQPPVATPQGLDGDIRKTEHPLIAAPATVGTV